MQRWPDVPNADQTMPVDGEVEVGVVHDDDRVLAAELEVHVLERRPPPPSSTSTPVSREPVSVITRTSGWRTSRSPTVLAAAVDDVDDARRDARLGQQLDEALRERAACRSAGLRTTVLPQTSAGTIFQDGIAIGKFHGVIAPTTPIGMRTLMFHLSRSSDGVVWPKRRRPSPAM